MNQMHHLTNRSIAKDFNKLAKLMELHGEDRFRIKAYASAYDILRKQYRPLRDMESAEMLEIPGLGKAIVSKIEELCETGTMSELDRLEAATPAGIQEMIKVRSFTPKKIALIWNQLGIENIEDLHQACIDNKLVVLKGFGAKTQADLQDKLAYYIESRGKFQHATVESAVDDLKQIIENNFSQDAALVGAAVQYDQIVEGIEILVLEERLEEFQKLIETETNSSGQLLYQGISVELIPVDVASFAVEQLERNSTSSFINYLQDEFGYEPEDYLDELDESSILASLDLPYIQPELRDAYPQYHEEIDMDELIKTTDIKGIIHCHSTYSDGLHSLEEMAQFAQEQGYEYLVITDHSKSAFYANGLQVDRVQQQWKEIDRLNAAMNGFKIFKGIESDILSDGSLDYTDDILNGFDLVIASIHSGLNMSQEKATNRLIRAIEHPATRILGHPTARLLLSRQGYPIDHKAVIDACAQHDVVIELNTHPNRLDIDYTWLPYMREQAVLTSINSDAHAKEAMGMIRHGVRVARKVWSRAQDNLSSMGLEDFEQWLAQGKK